jgi:sec-independent protein translocase protein TatA
VRLGATEILLILMIALVVFGSSKLTGVGKALGTSIREFKQEINSPDGKGGNSNDEELKQEVSGSCNKGGDGSVGEPIRK